jgi:hypothetical protein
MELKTIEDLFQNMTAQILGLDPDSGVRISWPTEGAPAWEIDENIAFVRVTTEDRPYNRKRESKYTYVASPECMDHDITYTRIVSVAWLLYGPDSFDNAQLLRDAFFLQTNREELAGSNLYLIPDILEPRRVPELFGGRWWERADVTILFNEFVTMSSVAYFLKSAEIAVQVDSEESIEINVTE